MGSATQRGPVSGAAGNHLAHSRACLPLKTAAFFHPGAPLSSDNLFLSLLFTPNPTMLFYSQHYCTVIQSPAALVSLLALSKWKKWKLSAHPDPIYPGVCQQPPPPHPQEAGAKGTGSNLSGRSPLVHLVHAVGIHLFSKALPIYCLVYFTRQCFLLEQLCLFAEQSCLQRHFSFHFRLHSFWQILILFGEVENNTHKLGNECIFW